MVDRPRVDIDVVYHLRFRVNLTWNFGVRLDFLDRGGTAGSREHHLPRTTV